MTILWTHESAAHATNGKTAGGKASGSWQASRVGIDSRSVRAGDLFVAIKGDNFDGHDYVKDALAKGAVAALVSRVPKDILGGVDESKLLIVDDALKGLEDLGKDARARSKAKIVGVTGSVGKTSAKEMIKLALSAHGYTYATSGNYNNHIGTPLNLANLPMEAKFAVFEMGMNHAGEIAHLTNMVKPDVAVITNVEAVHIEFFSGIEGIADAKSEIFQGMNEAGVAVLPRDSAQYAQMARSSFDQGVKNIVTFGTHEKSDCRLIKYSASAKGCQVEASIHGTRISYSMKAVGKHWATLSLLTLATAHSLGLEDAKTAAALEGFAEVDGRGRLFTLPVVGGNAILIDDSYNASPAAMRAAFSKTVEVWEGNGRKGRKLAALGNMLELGASSADLHTHLAPDMMKAAFDKVFTAGEWMKLLSGALPSQMRGAHMEKAAELLAPIIKELKPGDVLLIKGSHGSKMYELVAKLKESLNSGSEMEKLHAV